MNIPLEPDLEAFIRAKVKAGQFSSAAEVVATAISLLRDADQMAELAEERLRKLIDEGLEDVAKGRVSDWDVNELKDFIRKNAS